MAIEMKEVKSSNIQRVGYDPLEKTMRVQFSSGTAFVYKDVPRETFDNLRSAKSIGNYFAQNIRPNFKGELVVKKKD